MGQVDNQGFNVKEDGTIVRDSKSSKINQMKKNLSFDNSGNSKPENKGGGSSFIWIIGLLLVLLGIGTYFFLNRGKEEPFEKEEPFSLQMVNFVNQAESNATIYDMDDWEKSSNTFDSLIHVYGAIYNNLSLQDLDIVDDAIDRYNLLTRKSISEGSTVIVDDIEYDDSESPSYEWKEKYASICKTKINNMNLDNFSIPNEMMELHPCLVYLILKAKSISYMSDHQSWFDLYSEMTGEQINQLYGILYREFYKLGSIDKEYDLKKRANQFNTDAYEYAKTQDYYNAILTINKAIDLCPNVANYYDSKGEIYTMQGRLGRALIMWNKVMEIDPKFLQNIKGETSELYKRLKDENLIK